MQAEGREDDGVQKRLKTEMETEKEKGVRNEAHMKGEHSVLQVRGERGI